MHAIHRHVFGFTRIALGVVLWLALGSNGMAQQATSRGASKAVWPDNGIAQREFPNGSNMFVENDHGKWRAWVLENAEGNRVQALDFFSGEHMRVEVWLDDEGQQDFAFTDAKGRSHTSKGQRFESTRGEPESLGGISFNGQTFSIGERGCPTTLGSYVSNDKSKPQWNKVPIYYEAAAKGTRDTCPNGVFISTFDSVLDLGDGTFLAMAGCCVFHLRESDLSPVGSAPALHIVETSVVQAVIDKAKGKPILDATTYLAKALNLPTDAELSCKE